ncbi:hypothetical protein B7494_g6197 [Chlorociboria aeruginascens]|nr:hypothetical protein B7494_g6197 [Chlorociboria aeruginascens]
MTTETRTQFGILFSFVSIFIVVLVSYGLAWHLRNKREEEKEIVRKAGLIERGFGPIEEKEGHRQEERGQVEKPGINNRLKELVTRRVKRWRVLGTFWLCTSSAIRFILVWVLCADAMDARHHILLLINNYVQLALMMYVIVNLGLAIQYLNVWHEEEEEGVIIKEGWVVDKAARVVAPIWLSLTIICGILTIAEIVLFAIRKLKPLTFLMLTTVKTGVWTILFVLSMTAENYNSAIFSETISNIILLVILWISLVYGGIIFYIQKKSYEPVDILLDRQSSNKFSTTDSDCQ